MQLLTPAPDLASLFNFRTRRVKRLPPAWFQSILNRCDVCFCHQLTQQQVRRDDPNLQIPGSVRHVSQCLLRWGGVFDHSDGGTFPGLNDAPTTEWRHSGALLPQLLPRKTLNLLCQGLHDRNADLPESSKSSLQQRPPPLLQCNNFWQRCCLRF